MDTWTTRKISIFILILIVLNAALDLHFSCMYPQVHCYLPRFIHSELNHRNPHIWLPFSKHGNGQFPINHRPPPWNRRISPAMAMRAPPAVPGGPLWCRGEWFDTPHGRCSSPTTSATRARASGSMCRCYCEN